MAAKLVLRFETGALAGKSYEIGAGGLRFGRSSSNDVHTPDEELSRNHCFFEEANGVIRVTDLASANGTLLNGKALGADPAELSPGDVVEAGSTKIRVVEEGAEMIDLGLGSPAAPEEDKTPAASKIVNKTLIGWILFFLVLCGVLFCVGISIIQHLFSTDDPGQIQSALPDTNPEVRELYYEKIEGDSQGVFRYELRLDPDGVLHVRIDDVPNENRHVRKSSSLSDRAIDRLNEILSFDKLRGIDREYSGPDTEPPKLESCELRVVYSSRVRSVRIINSQEPEAFRQIRENLEAFTKNELGVWAIQYSRDKLVELAQSKVSLGKLKWDDRDVNYGNLAQSISAFNEAFFYLETVNPKPDFDAEAREWLDRVKAEHTKRYNEQRFLADRAINLGQWGDAQKELKVLLEMVPDRTDERNREAAAKLIDVERRMKKGDR